MKKLFPFAPAPAKRLTAPLFAHFTRNRQRFDKDARRAQQGRAIPALLDELMRDPYLKLAPPKSTGREYYGRTYLEKILRLGRHHKAKPNDLIRAATIFTVLSILDALNRFVLPETKIHQLIISGGGAKNPLILAQLSAALSVSRATDIVGARFSASQRSAQIEILPSSALGLHENAKESFAFALMAYETFHQRPSNVPSATGASRPAILGKISYASPR